MSKYKVKNNIFFILAEGIKIYFSNIDKFFLYMLFPVFGQIIGIILSFALPLGLADKVIAKSHSLSTALLMVLLLAMPGLLIFVKAFWDYMVAYVALNSMAEGAVSTGKVYDFQSHNEVATRRTFQYVLLLLAVGVLSSVASSIFFIIPGAVLWIYFILVFQVFTFEPELSVPDCFKRSLLLVRGKWLSTFFIMAVLVFFTIFIITEGATVVFDYLNLTDKIAMLFNFVTNKIPLDLCNQMLTYWHLPIVTPDMISKTIFYCILSFIVMGLTLPIRSICWTLWYKDLCFADIQSRNKLNKPARKQRRSKSFDEDE